MKKKDMFRREPRMNRMIRERVHDPYKTRRKLPEPTVCPQCGAVFHDGRWKWARRPADAHEELCQACNRTNDGYPAGVVTLTGDFVEKHKVEILQLARNQEEQEKLEHPLHRIMNIEQGEDCTVINTTDIHLPRRIGQKLFDAYEGDFDFHYDAEGYFVRVNWSREE
ncbi:MAG: BCAM0308 family protein [Alphaproteobacteria bacterium]